MDFDEYDYLEKTVEETNDPPKKETPEKGRERSEKGYRRRERSLDDEFDEEEKERKVSSKKSRNEENGGRDREKERERERDRDRDKDREKSSRHKSRERDSDRERRSEKDRDKERDSKDRGRDRDRERDRERSRDKDRDREKERREREREKEKERARRDRDKEKERERGRRSRSRSRLDREREAELLKEREREESRILALYIGTQTRVLPGVVGRFKDKKEAVEPEADPERDQRTVFAYQMPLKATERDVFEFFSQAGKVRDVKLIMDRNSRRSKGVGYIEFYEVMSVPMAIALSGHLFLGQPVMVKPSEAEKNLVQSNTTAGSSGVAGPYGATDRKLYVGNLHFNMTELQLKQIFEAFGPVELVQLPTDPETGHCKGFGFIQFSHLENAKAAQSLNGKLEIAGRTIKVSSVTDHPGVQDSGAKTADFDDDDGGGLALNAQSRAMLMAKLDRSGIASSVVGTTLGVPAINGAAPSQQAITMPLNPTAVLPTQVVSMVPEPIGIPSECLLLKNMFDPATEDEPEFDLDIRDDVQEECSKYGGVKHIYVDKSSAGYVYLRFDSVEGAARAQQAMHKRWFARRLISAIFLQPYEYDAKFKGTA